MKIFLRILLLVLVSVFGVSCASGPGYGQGPRRGGPGGQQGQGGQWYRTADGTYSHKRVAYNHKTGETKIINMGDVPNDDPGLLADARENGYRVLQKGESERVSPDQVPEHIRRKIAALPRQGGNSRFGGVVPTRGGYQPAPPCNGGQGGSGYPAGYYPQHPPQHDPYMQGVDSGYVGAGGGTRQYVPTIPPGMRAGDWIRAGRPVPR